MQKLTLASACVLASALLASSAQAKPHWYWSPAYAEARLAQRGLADASCRGVGRDRVRAPKDTGSKYVFRAFNCQVGDEQHGLLVRGQVRYRLLDGPLGPDPAP